MFQTLAFETALGGRNCCFGPFEDFNQVILDGEVVAVDGAPRHRPCYVAMLSHTVYMINIYVVFCCVLSYCS